MTKILFNLAEDANNELKALAARWKTSKSHVIRFAIYNLIKQYKPRIREWDPQDYTSWRDIEETIEIAKTKWINED